MPVKIFVGNLDEYASERNLRAAFERYGEVVECDILSKFGFVHMANEDEAKAAINALHRSEFDGSRINVELSKGDGGGGRGRGRGGRGGDRGGRDRDENGYGGRSSRGRGRGGGDRLPPSRRSSRYDPYSRSGRDRSPPRRDPYADPYYDRDPYGRYPPPERDPYSRYPPPPERDPYWRSRDPYARPHPYPPRDPRDPYARPPPEYYYDTYARRSPGPDPYYDRYYDPLRRPEDARSRYPAPPAGAAAVDRKPPTADPYSQQYAPQTSTKDSLLGGGIPQANSTAYPQTSRAYGAPLSQAADAAQGYGRPAAVPTMGQGMAGQMGGYRAPAATAQNQAYRAPAGGYGQQSLGGYGQQTSMATNGQAQAPRYY